MHLVGRIQSTLRKLLQKLHWKESGPAVRERILRAAYFTNRDKRKTTTSILRVRKYPHSISFTVIGQASPREKYTSTFSVITTPENTLLEKINNGKKGMPLITPTKRQDV